VLCPTSSEEEMAQFQNAFSENDIKAFVHTVFAYYDRHVDIDKLLGCFVENGLEVHFPDRIVLIMI
jgi:hypothetical protein